MTLTLAQWAAQINVTDAKAAVGSGQAVDNFAATARTAFTIGTGSGAVDVMWRDQRQLVGTSEDLDLAGVLTNQFGAVATFAKVRGIYIRNTETGAGKTLSVGGAAANQFLTPFGAADDKVKIGPGGVLMLTSPVDGFAVTAGTGDKLKIDAGAQTITYEICIVGTSV